MARLSRGEGQQKTSSTGTGTNAGATATITHAAGTQTVVTHISGSGDAAAVVTVESPSGTVLWQQRFAAAFTFSQNFHFGELATKDSTSDILVKVSASTSHAEANIAGLRADI